MSPNLYNTLLPLGSGYFGSVNALSIIAHKFAANKIPNKKKHFNGTRNMNDKLYKKYFAIFIKILWGYLSYNAKGCKGISFGLL